MVRSNTEAYAAALKVTKNTPGMCQKVTRDYYLAPSAGDQDHDGDADANDGWKLEPESACVYGDRNPPKGAPLYFKNKSGRGHGHRCISTGSGSGARSTDMKNNKYTPGVTSNTTIEALEREMGLVYRGWSRTISAKPIPGLEKKVAKPPAKPKPSTPAKPAPKPEFKLKDDEIMVRLVEVSLQFNDTTAQKNADCEKIFKECADTGQWGIMGTESFEANTKLALKKAAAKHGFFLYIGTGTDAWVAVNKKRVRGTSFKGYTGPTIVKGKAGVNAAKKVVRATFTNPDIGRVTLYACHNVSKDRIPEQKRVMKAYGADAKKQAAGLGLAWLGADANVQDAKFDTVYGNGFISCWDELKKYPSTGHGTIDVICRFKSDTRVKFHAANSKGDKDFPLHTDHFKIAAAYVVKKLKK